MEINERTQERLAEKLLAEMTKARLLNKDVAVKFDAKPSDMSNLKRKDNYKKIASRIWKNIHTWYNSGVPLEFFRLAPPVEERPDPADQLGKQAEQYMKDHEQAPETTTAAAEPARTPEPTPVGKIEPVARNEPTEEEAAAYKKEAREATKALREEHEAQDQILEIQPETEITRVVIRTKGKILTPMEKINPKTGTRITVEILDDCFTITIPRK